MTGKFILIWIWFAGGVGATSGHVEFNRLEDCERFAESLMASNGRIWAHCEERFK